MRKKNLDTPLARYRETRKLTLEQLGSKLGVNKSTLMRWEANRIPAERLGDVEQVTGIPRYVLRPDIFLAKNGGAE